MMGGLVLGLLFGMTNIVNCDPDISDVSVFLNVTFTLYDLGLGLGPTPLKLYDMGLKCIHEGKSLSNASDREGIRADPEFASKKTSLGSLK